jgi:hypothetical protein
VLPFENLTGDPAQEYFSDGLTEEMITRLTGILALQNDVARGIAGALVVRLLPVDEARLADVRTVNPAAYEAYLLGQSHARRLTRPELDRALEYYEAAVKHDPQFALPHFGISGVWAGRVQTGLVPPSA